MEKAVVRFFQMPKASFIPLPINPTLFHLVVSAPQGQAGTMAQATCVLDYFFVHILQEIGLPKWIHAAGEDVFLPDKDAILVAEVIKVLGFVKASAPDPEHVLMHKHCISQDFLKFLPGDAGGEGIRWDPVRAFGEDAHAIDRKFEAFAPLIRFLD